MDRATALHVLDLSVDADRTAIKTAYRRLSLASHPDRGGDPHLFRLVQEAHEALQRPPTAQDRTAPRADSKTRAASDARPFTTQEASTNSTRRRVFIGLAVLAVIIPVVLAGISAIRWASSNGEQIFWAFAGLLALTLLIDP